ncbi:MAG: preprotein translocase subunit SecG [Mariprofundaceae bacterium]|nr:preprotein translocase subunit SecG [Mariprofundaceae bacterium]
MTSIIITIHILVSIALIAVILIQRGQGADMGSSFGGGGAQTLFGSQGSSSFLTKATGALAVVFMITSLTLAFFSQKDVTSVVGSAVIPMQSQAQSKEATDNSAKPGAFNTENLKDDGLPSAE